MEILHHALLYALLCKHTIEVLGKDEGEKAIEVFTRDYGLFRGRRMKDNSLHGDINDFFINGEWRGKPGENISQMSFEEGQSISVVSKCAWYDTWKKYGLLDYGPYYCRYIDKAIAEGYGSDFTLQVEETIGQGDERCIFKWTAQADETLLNESERKHILPFEKHCKDLLNSAEKYLDETILAKTKEDFEKEFGKTKLFD